MINVYKAPIDEADVAPIVAYLVHTKGENRRMRRGPEPMHCPRVLNQAGCVALDFRQHCGDGG
jgi:hypothetical protein